MSNFPEFAANQARHMMQCWSSQEGYDPIAVDRTEGCWIHTSDGRRIFDLRSAHECINLGFNHPRVIAALKRQLEQVIYVTDDFATEPTGALARRLAELTPGSCNKRVYFAQSGAAAVEAAIKGARLFQYNRMFHEGGIRHADAPGQYPYPYKIISRYKSWHGSTASASSVSGDPRRWFQEPLTVPGVVFAPEANAFRPPFGTPENYVEENLNYLEYIIENEGGSNKVAAVILEPVVGSNGIIPAPPGYLRGVRDICDRWGLLMIVDETMTGMGRTGKLLAIEHSDVEPDIIIMGKALGAYCPLTATVFSEKVSASFDKHIFGHGQSYSGHALGCAGALAALDVLLEDGVLNDVEKKGQYLESKLRELAEKHSCVGDVRGIGLFFTMELVADRQTKEPLRKTTEKYSRTIVKDVSEFLFKEKNIYVPSDKFGIWVVPPLIVTEQEIDWFCAGIDEALDMVDQRLCSR
ncbi:MAG: aspartate aminotransferase family protein [Verrucomicrobia bacterium]|nr:aspartate aminotransferase family protein [Verrucomicrobiota bacterium]